MAQEAVVWLRRVGLDRVRGYLKTGMFEWAKAGLPMNHVPQMSAQELYTAVSEKESIVVLDVRTPQEYKGFHIDGAINIPAPDLRKRYTELNLKTAYAVICGTGHRSSMAASILKQHGFTQIYNVAGGMTGYNAAGYI
jgi:rhodanese-related sulfurtransferase